VTDDDLLRLQLAFPEQTVIGALDLIDRGNVHKYTTAWGHTEYEVIGSSGTYLVLLEVSTVDYPYFCSCPAFLHYVHQQRNHTMCKHILATRLADRTSTCSQRQMELDGLASLHVRHYPSASRDEPEHS
ncbi:Zinc finger SWIM domain-containing protein 7, partial [Leucoagaricus sp. SymC.cos]